MNAFLLLYLSSGDEAEFGRGAGMLEFEPGIMEWE